MCLWPPDVLSSARTSPPNSSHTHPTAQRTFPFRRPVDFPSAASHTLAVEGNTWPRAYLSDFLSPTTTPVHSASAMRPPHRPCFRSFLLPQSLSSQTEAWWTPLTSLRPSYSMLEPSPTRCTPDIPALLRFPSLHNMWHSLTHHVTIALIICLLLERKLHAGWTQCVLFTDWTQAPGTKAGTW